LREEEARYEAALAAFAQAFAQGYAEGKRLLATDATRPDVDFPFEIDIPRSAVLADQWKDYVRHFEQAGMRAALSLQRKGEAKLDPTEACEGSALAFFEGTYRWYVVDER
jgi:hypothetical protein